MPQQLPSVAVAVLLPIREATLPPTLACIPTKRLLPKLPNMLKTPLPLPLPRTHLDGAQKPRHGTSARLPQQPLVLVLTCLLVVPSQSISSGRVRVHVRVVRCTRACGAPPAVPLPGQLAAPAQASGGDSLVSANSAVMSGIFYPVRMVIYNSSRKTVQLIMTLLEILRYYM